METPAVLAPPLEPDADSLASFHKLYAQGRYRTLYEQCQGLAPFLAWRSPEALAFAGRLARNLGDLRLGDRLDWRAWRTDRRNPAAQEAYIRLIWRWRGPLAAWHHAGDPDPDWGIAQRADRLIQQAELLTAFRDFTAAGERLALARQLTPEDPWLGCVEIHLLRTSDRPKEALALACTNLTRHPWYRPLVQEAAELHIHLDQPEEAARLLESAMEHLESCWVAWQLAYVQLELGRTTFCNKTLDQFLTLAPLINEQDRQAVAGMRAELAYRMGDIDGACAAAVQGDLALRKQMETAIKP